MSWSGFEISTNAPLQNMFSFGSHIWFIMPAQSTSSKHLTFEMNVKRLYAYKCICLLRVSVGCAVNTHYCFNNVLKTTLYVDNWIFNIAILCISNEQSPSPRSGWFKNSCLYTVSYSSFFQFRMYQACNRQFLYLPIFFSST